MDSGLYVAYAGLLARTQSLDSAASNLANASTTGFRAEREYFQSAVAGDDSFGSLLGKTLNSFSVLGGNVVDLNQGQLAATGNSLDIGIQGNGFFTLQGPQGIRYTRDGSFERLTDGTIQSRAGEQLLDVDGKPVVVPAGEITVGTDGSLSVDGNIVASLGVYDLSASSLIPEGVNRYQLAAGAQRKLSSAASLHQGYLESSNQDVIHGSLQLVLLQRQAETMQKAVSLFQNSFDKAASEDLPKV